MSAVPSDAPRFWAVPWRPPASLVWSGATDDMMTLPSCEARRPDADPEDREGEREADLLQLHVDRRDQPTAPIEQRDEPDLDDPLR